MVDTPADPLRPPTITQTPQEIDQMYDLIEQGKLPKDYVDRHFEAVRLNVFGHDAKKVKGQYQEQGIGSATNQTANSLAAYKKYCDPSNPKAPDPDPNFVENYKRMEAELKASTARRTEESVKNKGGQRRRYSA